MKKLLIILCLVSSTLYAQNAEEAIKRTVEAEAKALKAHQPELNRTFWKFDKTEPHIIIRVSLPNGIYFGLTGADLADDSKFPPADNVVLKNSNYRIRINGNLAYASYETTQTKPDGSFIKSHRIDLLEKVGNDWKITEVSEHYFLPK